MKLVTSLEQMRTLSSQWKQEGRKIGLVPTMGFFHEGHLALMREARKLCDKTVVSLFVNPIQFGPSEDLEAYPRDLDRDMELAAEQGVDVLYHPDAKQMYPPGFQTTVQAGELAIGLCGGKRPGHFDGVCTVVNKLFNQVQPHLAVFGEKDFQQLAVIRRMVNDLNINVDIRGYPTVREPDGLAMSSRNSYLNPEERKKALCLSQSIAFAQELSVKDRTVDLRMLENTIIDRINKVEGCRVDYVSIVDETTLQPSSQVDSNCVLVMAVFINNSVRLIDNGKLIL